MEVVRIFHKSLHFNCKGLRTRCPNVRWLHESSWAVNVVVYSALYTGQVNPIQSNLAQEIASVTIDARPGQGNVMISEGRRST